MQTGLKDNESIINKTMKGIKWDSGENKVSKIEERIKEKSDN